MSHKKIISVLLGLSVVGFIAGIILTEPEKYGICSPDATFACIEPIGNNIGQPLGLGSLALTSVFVILIFLPKHYFTAWLKFGAWWIPLSILWIATTPTNSASGIGISMSLDRELVIWWSSGIFIIVSLLIIVIKAIRRRGQQHSQSALDK